MGKEYETVHLSWIFALLILVSLADFTDHFHITSHPGPPGRGNKI